MRTTIYLLAMTVAALPSVTMAQNRTSAAQNEQRAFEDCGGPPIQGGHPVQPTPGRDACLARMQHQPLPHDLQGPAPSSAHGSGDTQATGRQSGTSH